jgi:hypothetical protein
MARRSGKYYYKNEKQTMRDLGFKPTAASGSGWLEKEDGQSDNAIAQLKSTDKQSIKIDLLDIQKLEHSGLVSHKRPVFVIQFLQTNDIFLVVRPEQDILDMIHDHFESKAIELGESEPDDIRKIQECKTGRTSRDKFYEERAMTYEKENETRRKIRRSHSKEKPKRELEPRLPI